jgi:hypothetical protein
LADGAFILGGSQGSGLYHDFDFDMQIQERICGEGSDTRMYLVSASRRPCPRAIVRYCVRMKQGKTPH